MLVEFKMTSYVAYRIITYISAQQQIPYIEKKVILENFKENSVVFTVISNLR